MITLNNVSIHLPLRRARLRRKMISGRATSGGEIIQIGDDKFVAALQNISFTLAKGDCVALIGHNGSGKTTLLRTLAKIYEPTTGHITTNGAIATMFSSALSLSDMETGRQNIEFSAILHGIPTDTLHQSLSKIIDICGLGGYIDVPLSMYSDGMRARLGLAMAIVANPSILLIDEAMTTVDTHFISSVSEKTGLFIDPERLFIMATHARDIQDRYCNKAIWLDHGHLKAVGKYSDIREAYETSRLKAGS